VKAALQLAVVDAEAAQGAGSPGLDLVLHAEVGSALRVYTIALRCELAIEPARRRYDAATRARLSDLLGGDERGTTTPRLAWSQADVLVPSFRGATDLRLRQPCTFDPAAPLTRYCAALRDGAIPLVFHFSGTIFLVGDDGRLELEPVPWNASAEFELPVETWRAAGAGRPDVATIRLHTDTLAALARFRSQRGLATFDDAVAELLSDAPRGASAAGSGAAWRGGRRS
jgi:hypothetical protein